MKFGFTSTSFRNIKDVEKVVSVAMKTGADCIEWGGDIHVKDVETAKRVRKLCDDAKISVSAFGSYYRVGNGDEKEWQKTCEIAAALGTDLIRVWLGKADSEKTDDDTYKSLVEEVKYMCEVASGYGLIVSPECHDHTYNNNTDAQIHTSGTWLTNIERYWGFIEVNMGEQPALISRTDWGVTASSASQSYPS